MQNETLYERIKRLSNVPIKQLELELGLKDGLIQKWKQSKPRIDNFSLVAKRLGVSMEYLWTGEENRTMELSNKRTTTALSPELAELAQDERFVDIAKLYKQMSRHYRERIFVYVLGVANGLRFNVQKILGK